MAARSKRGVKSIGTSLTVRLDPRLRFALELMSRKQRRSMSGVIEWLIECGVEKLESGVNKEMLSYLWGYDDFDRIQRMKVKYPSLLTYEEEKILTKRGK